MAINVSIHYNDGFLPDMMIVESKRRTLHAVGKDGGLRTRWSYSIVELAHLAVVTMFFNSACQDTLRALSLGSLLSQLFCVRCIASQLRAGRDSVSARLTDVLGLRCRVSLSSLSRSFDLECTTRVACGSHSTIIFIALLVPTCNSYLLISLP